jgi:hypothetical protein
MTCDDCRRDLLFYAGGELLPGEASAIEAHLRECGDCRLALEEERAFARDVHNASVQFRHTTKRVGDRLSHEPRRATLRRTLPAHSLARLARPGAAMAAYVALCVAAAAVILFRAQDPGTDRVVSWAVEHYPLIDQTHPLRGDAVAVREWFKEHHGLDVSPPRDADYSTLAGCKMTEIDSEPAPFLRFEGKDTSAIFMLPPGIRSAAEGKGVIRMSGYMIRVWSEGDCRYLKISRSSPEGGPSPDRTTQS